ncbi:unnamed protein product, partial [Phaeothamnion confervicola]
SCGDSSGGGSGSSKNSSAPATPLSSRIGSADLDMWHSRTHWPDGALQDLARRGLISLKPSTSNNRRHCSACAVANSRRLPTPKMTRRVETAPLELVYVDL